MTRDDLANFAALVGWVLVLAVVLIVWGGV